jgi:hypothetical protein
MENRGDTYRLLQAGLNPKETKICKARRRTAAQVPLPSATLPAGLVTSTPGTAKSTREK